MWPMGHQTLIIYLEYDQWDAMYWEGDPKGWSTVLITALGSWEKPVPCSHSACNKKILDIRPMGCQILRIYLTRDQWDTDTENILYMWPIVCMILRIYLTRDQWDARYWEYTLHVTNGMPDTENILEMWTVGCQILRIYSTRGQ
jgi:hypothetical protein